MKEVKYIADLVSFGLGIINPKRYISNCGIDDSLLLNYDYQPHELSMELVDYKGDNPDNVWWDYIIQNIDMSMVQRKRDELRAQKAEGRISNLTYNRCMLAYDDDDSIASIAQGCFSIWKLRAYRLVTPSRFRLYYTYEDSYDDVIEVDINSPTGSYVFRELDLNGKPSGRYHNLVLNSGGSFRNSQVIEVEGNVIRNYEFGYGYKPGVHGAHSGHTFGALYDSRMDEPETYDLRFKTEEGSYALGPTFITEITLD